MRKQESQNEKVDQLAKRLIGQSMLTESEIDKIVASPMLYSSIRNRVNATPAANPTFVLFRTPVVAALASLLVVAGVAGFVFLRNGEPAQTEARTLPKQTIPEKFNRVTQPDGLGDKFNAPEPAEDRVPRETSRMQIQNATYRKPVTANPRPLRPRPERQPDIEFIPLVYTDDPAESVKGGRVIRVEMSRASLFAMGINVPLENGADTVKADLLVGQDGVPRGIRMPQ